MQPGTYTATVTVTDPDGGTGTATVEIVVANPPGNRAPSVEAAGRPGRRQAAAGGAVLGERDRP